VFFFFFFFLNFGFQKEDECMKKRMSFLRGRNEEEEEIKD